MDNKSQSRKQGGENEEHLPSYGEPVWVQCEGYRCLAFLAKDGKWRNFYNKKELGKVFKILAAWLVLSVFSASFNGIQILQHDRFPQIIRKWFNQPNGLNAQPSSVSIPVFV